MNNTDFTPGLILNTLFLYTIKKQRCLAEHYLFCDRTLVYKWAGDTVILPKKHVPTIVLFVMEQTHLSDRLQIRCDIETVLSRSSLSDQCREALEVTEDFADFIKAVLLHAISLSFAKSKGLHKNYVTKVPRRIEIRHIIYGIFAAITGGILWSLLNMLFKLNYYMGGSGNEPSGMLSVVWGMLTCTPVAVCAMLCAKKDSFEVADRKRAWMAVVLYSLLSGVGAFIFYNSGFRLFFQQLNFLYGFQEFIIAGVYAFFISIFPITSFVLFLPHLRPPLRFVLAGMFLPSVAAAITAFGTWLVGRPEAEVAQLRGFAIGLGLRLCMFVVAYLYLSGLKSGRVSSCRSDKRVKDGHLSPDKYRIIQ